MMTRGKAQTRDLELQLRNTLEDLKASRDLSDQLMKEREENEKEFECLLKKNTSLKNVVTELDIQCQDLQGKCDELSNLLHSYQQCQDIHEVTLSQIHSLEQQLAESNAEIHRLNEKKQHDANNETMALYDELVSSHSKTVPTIDLTTPCKELQYDDCCEKKIKIIGANKLKKYCRINRFISRTKKTIKKYKTIPHQPLKTEKVRLGTLVQKYEKEISKQNQELADCNEQYEINMAMLQQRLNNLKLVLNTPRVPSTEENTTSSQMSAALALSEATQDASPIQPATNTSLGTHTSDIAKQLQQSTPASTTCTPDEFRPDGFCNDEPATPSLYTPMSKQPAVTPASSSCTSLQEEAPSSSYSCSPYETIVFSDKLGSKMGYMLNDYLRQKVVNICMPGASFKQIVDRIVSGQYSLNTKIVFVRAPLFFWYEDS